jgi:hypothetical protein
MTALSESGAAIVEQSAVDAVTRLTKANKHALDFMFGAQRVMLEEIVFAGNEMLDRARTETHLFSEFVSKMAGSHSLNELKLETVSTQPASGMPRQRSVSGAFDVSGCKIARAPGRAAPFRIYPD